MIKLNQILLFLSLIFAGSLISGCNENMEVNDPDVIKKHLGLNPDEYEIIANRYNITWQDATFQYVLKLKERIKVKEKDKSTFHYDGKNAYSHPTFFDEHLHFLKDKNGRLDVFEYVTNTRIETQPICIIYVIPNDGNNFYMYVCIMEF